MYFIQHCFISRPSDSNVSEDAGIEPRTVIANFALAARALTTRLDLIHNSARPHPHSARPYTHRVIFPWTIFPLFRRGAPAVFPQKELIAFHCTFDLRPFTPTNPSLKLSILC
jgi:hypothetical protein